MRGKHSIHNQQGFTLIEIIAVLILLGILAEVAVPKYIDLTVEANKKAAQGQIGEMKGRLSSALANYMLKNNGAKPANGADLVAAANTYKTNSCPTEVKDEGDFDVLCKGNEDKTVTITVSKVQDANVSESGTYSFAD